MPTQANFAALDGLHTFPRLLLHHAKNRPDAPAIREKALGIWQTWTWSDVADRVRSLACGLAELGFKRGDNLAIIGDNRPHLYMMMAAAQCLGGSGTLVSGCCCCRNAVCSAGCRRAVCLGRGSGAGR